MTKSDAVLLVGGSDEYQRRRFVAKIVSARRKDGWTITEVNGGEDGALDPVFAMSAMFEANNLVLVENPEKLEPRYVTEYLKDPDPKLTLLLITDSDKPGAAFESVPKKIFSLPPFYKMEEFASQFVVSEMRSRGFAITESLALSLVKKVGVDLGLLSFEIQKVGHLLAPGESVTADHLRGSLAALAETDGTGIVDALGTRDTRRFVVEMSKYRASRGGDPTIELSGRVLTPALVRWLQAAHLDEARLSPAAAAGSVGANPWYWEHKILPPARLWKVSGCAKMIRIVARAQTLVFQGAVSPISFLESSFLAVLLD